MTAPTAAPNRTATSAKHVKLTSAEQAAQARAEIALAHATPFFDLTIEPWLPVTVPSGEVRTVGLRELLTNAHQIADLAVQHPLIRASLRRFLQGLVADLIRRGTAMNDDAWWDAHAGNTGFPTDLVDQVFAAHSQSLWLWHPTSPFLQQPTLPAVIQKPQDAKPAVVLVLDIPGGASAAWWSKAGDPNVTRGLSPAETAQWLTTRWFYAANGNSARIDLPDGQISKHQYGGAFAEGPATVTHVWRVDGTSLFRTFLRNLTGPLATGPVGMPAWLDPHQPRPSIDALYLATIGISSVLLTARDEQDHTRSVAFAPAVADKDSVKAIRDQASDIDPHRSRYEPLKVGDKPRTVRVTPAAQRSNLLRNFYRAGLEGRGLRGVVRASDLWLTDISETTARAENLDLLLVEKNASVTSPVWLDVSGALLPARQVDPDSPDAEQVRAAVAVAFDPTDGLHVRLSDAVRDLLAGRGPGGWDRPKATDQPAAGMTAVLVEDWTARVEIAFQDALDGRLPHNEWQRAAYAAAREAFQVAAAPYTSTTRYAFRYATALRRLTPRRAQ